MKAMDRQKVVKYFYQFTILLAGLGLAGCGPGQERPTQEQPRSLRVASAHVEQTTQSQRLELWETQGRTQLGRFPATVEVNADGRLTVRLQTIADFPPATVVRGYVDMGGGTTVPLRRALGDQSLYAQLPSRFTAPLKITLYTWEEEEPYARNVVTLEFQEPNATETKDALDTALQSVREKKSQAGAALVPVLESICEFANMDAAEDVAARLTGAADDPQAPYDDASRKVFREVASALRHATETQQTEQLLELMEKLRESAGRAQ